MELGGNVIGSITGSLHLEGEGDTIEVNPIVTSGTKIATITVNEGKPDEANFDLYAPEYTPFSGVYNDLTGKPHLNGQVISDNMYTDIYSLNEVICGKWFDNSLTYQKTWLLDTSIYIDSNGVLLPTEIQNDMVNVNNVIMAMAIRLQSSNANSASIPLEIWKSSEGWKCLCGDSWGYISVIIIKYTKNN